MGEPRSSWLHKHIKMSLYPGKHFSRRGGGRKQRGDSRRNIRYGGANRRHFLAKRTGPWSSRSVVRQMSLRCEGVRAVHPVVRAEARMLNSQRNSRIGISGHWIRAEQNVDWAGMILSVRNSQVDESDSAAPRCALRRSQCEESHSRLEEKWKWRRNGLPRVNPRLSEPRRASAKRRPTEPKGLEGVNRRRNLRAVLITRLDPSHARSPLRAELAIARARPACGS
jgi:hypothetical protein